MPLMNLHNYRIIHTVVVIALLLLLAWLLHYIFTSTPKPSIFQAGMGCNTNSVCEATLRETHENCPEDCPAQ